MDRVRDIVNRADRMRADRGTYDAHCQEVRDYVVPLLSAVNRIETPGAKAHSLVLDNTGETAADMLAGALVSTLTPDTIDWFSLRAINDRINGIPAAAQWLETASSRMNAVFRAPRGGFSTSQHEKYLSVVNFGQAGSFIANRPGRGIIFSSVPLRQLLLAEDSDGFVNTVYRDFCRTARQAVDRWGNKCGAKILKAAGDPKRQDTPFRFVHAVEPRKKRDPSQRDRRNMPFTSTYVCVEDMHELDDGGFEEMPYMTPRWSKRDEEVYGRGPGMKALGDVKSLQRTMKVTIRGGEKLIDPPMMVADDGVIGPVRTGPNGLTYYRSGTYSIDPIKALLTGGRPDIGEDIMRGIRERIENAFMKPLIQMVRKDRMTATEVLQVTEEGQRILGPYLGRLKTEDLGPMIERVFGIMLRGDAFPPMPQELAGQTIEVEYESPALKTQRVAQARALAQFNDITAPMVQLDPSLVDNIDTDRAYRDTGDVIGLPKSWWRDPATVEKRREARAQQQAQQQQQQQLIEGAGAAANVVRALPALKQATETANV